MPLEGDDYVVNHLLQGRALSETTHELLYPSIAVY